MSIDDIIFNLTLKTTKSRVETILKITLLTSICELISLLFMKFFDTRSNVYCLLILSPPVEEKLIETGHISLSLVQKENNFKFKHAITIKNKNFTHPTFSWCLIAVIHDDALIGCGQ